MRKFTTQIILISGQMIPNVTPVMDKVIRPEKIILCASNAMQKRACVLEKFFERKKFGTEIFSLGDAYDLTELKNRFLELAIRFEPQKEQVAVNLTGGTKLMTIAAQLVFAENKFDCFYVVPNEDSIIMVTSEQDEKYEIQDRLTLEDFFAIHGYTVKSLCRLNKTCREDQVLFNELLGNYQKYRKSIGGLNYLAAKAEDAFSLQIKQNIQEHSWDLLSLFQQQGSIEYFDDKVIKFKDETSRDFCKGLWLEKATLAALQQVKKEFGLQDFAGSIEITGNNGIKNEIDAAFLHNNNLYIIECKTAQMTAKGSDTLYKIDTVKNYAGMLTRPILISFKPLAGHDRRRAESLGIALVEGDALKNLAKKFIKFLDNEKTGKNKK